MSAWFKWGIALGLFFAVFAVLDHFGPKVCSDVILSTHLRPPQFWIFDPKVLHSVAKEALARKTPVNETMLYIQRALAKKYPGHVVEDQEWMYNIAGALRVQERAKMLTDVVIGGAMGGMTILHASITEYLIFFGTTVGTEGHTVRTHQI